jgi:LEA14-like dessication related protein
MNDYLKFFLRKCGAKRMSVKKIIKVHHAVVFLFIIMISSFPCYVLGNSNLKTPSVTVSLEKVFLTDIPSANLDVTFIIYNPNNISISLEGISYDIYVNQKFVSKQLYVSLEPENPFITVIGPNETKMIKHNPAVDLASVNEEVKNLILEGTQEWNFAGNAVFSSSLGDLIAPIVTKKTKIIFEGGKFPILVNLSTITIEVKNETWLPITGAKVTLISKETSFEGITDASGSVEFDIPTTNYTIKVSKEGYMPHEELLEISIPSTVKRVIQLHPSVRLILEVKDETGKPLNNANIILFSKDFGNFNKTTNASGIAEFEIPRTSYTLSVVKKGYLAYEEVLDLSKSPIESKVIQLKPELTWLEQHWLYLIIGVIVLCIIIFPIVLRLKRRF